MTALLIEEFGPWLWWILGFILLALELVAPGVFLLWLGIAAIVTGAIALIITLSGPLQFAVFAVLSVVFAIIGKRVYSNYSMPSDNENLNDRSKNFIGRTFTLIDDMDGGQGRIKISETYWLVQSSENHPAGTNVRVIAADGVLLKVEPAE